MNKKKDINTFFFPFSIKNIILLTLFWKKTTTNQYFIISFLCSKIFIKI
jgi:hypothetical protein